MIFLRSGMGSTMQGIVGAAFEGAGVAIGSLVGGAIYESQVETLKPPSEHFQGNFSALSF